MLSMLPGRVSKISTVGVCAACCEWPVHCYIWYVPDEWGRGGRMLDFEHRKPGGGTLLVDLTELPEATAGVSGGD